MHVNWKNVVVILVDLSASHCELIENTGSALQVFFRDVACLDVAGFGERILLPLDFLLV